MRLSQGAWHGVCAFQIRVCAWSNGAARIHVSGPERGDLVVVSGEVVVAAIADGRITVGEAQRAGLIRLYGSDDQIAWFLAAFQDVGTHRVHTACRGSDTLH